MTEPAFNKFLRHTDLPVNSGGSGDPGIRYQHQAHLDDLTPSTDKVYLNPITKRYFKVRAKRLKRSDGRVDIGDSTIIISVSQCDADGYALKDDMRGWAICPEHSFNPPGDSPVELDVALEQSRLIQCAAAELRVFNEAALASIPVEDDPD